MAQGYGRPVTPRASQELTKQLWAESQVNKGLITTIDPADIDDGALTDAKNVRIRFDKTSRRPGSTTFTPTDSDSLTAMKFATFKQNDGKIYLIKLSPTGPRFTDLSTWYGPTGGSLAGTVNDRFNTAISQDKFIFANNGVDYVQQLTITPLPGTYSRLGNAPKAKFVTGFYNRIVVAYYTDPVSGTPVSLGWSGDLNPTEFDPLVDISAGTSPIVESPGDETDFISGVFGFTNVMIVMRERSIWVATKQPIASNPFFFSSAVAGIGSNCPYSIVVMPNGLIWVDTITGTVWAYELGGTPERIGLPIEKDLIKGISDPNIMFGSFSQLNYEYTAVVPIVGTNTVRLWTYNFRSKSWVYDEINDVTDISDSIALPSVTMMDDLGGSFDSLQGSIDSLSSVIAVSSTRLTSKDIGPSIDELTGTMDALAGTMDSLSSTVTLREDPSKDQDDAINYESIIASKDFIFPSLEIYTAEVKIEYVAQKAGQMILEYSKDSGSTWTTKKTITTSELNVPRYVRFVGQYKARRMRWRLRSISGLYDVLEYEVHVFAGPESRNK